ncbi:uncharacterized protein LOC119835266 [Zerene cesonia]|uniref:uncharacterized protein LOC119835266 n=1 Tax=Zerene cesonia TaxID=33412 RepID=UPI0018E5872E|nr:uncharacterized protein LOC119835266 [Zerene cesonia]
MFQMKLLGALTLFQLYMFVYKVNALECYVCDNQEDNSEKCVKTIMTCEYNQDVCLTEIKWGSTPYWSQGAKKQYYVSKRCSNKTECVMTRQHYMPLCTHIWYQDWTCSDCCQGDRCNYFIISGQSSTKPALAVFFGTVAFAWIFHNYL